MSFNFNPPTDPPTPTVDVEMEETKTPDKATSTAGTTTAGKTSNEDHEETYAIINAAAKDPSSVNSEVASALIKFVLCICLKFKLQEIVPDNVQYMWALALSLFFNHPTLVVPKEVTKVVKETVVALLNSGELKPNQTWFVVCALGLFWISVEETTNGIESKLNALGLGYFVSFLPLEVYNKLLAALEGLQSDDGHLLKLPIDIINELVMSFLGDDAFWNKYGMADRPQEDKEWALNTIADFLKTHPVTLCSDSEGKLSHLTELTESSSDNVLLVKDKNGLEHLMGVRELLPCAYTQYLLNVRPILLKHTKRIIKGIRKNDLKRGGLIVQSLMRLEMFQSTNGLGTLMHMENHTMPLHHWHATNVFKMHDTLSNSNTKKDPKTPKKSRGLDPSGAVAPESFLTPFKTPLKDGLNTPEAQGSNSDGGSPFDHTKQSNDYFIKRLAMSVSKIPEAVAGNANAIERGNLAAEAGNVSLGKQAEAAVALAKFLSPHATTKGKKIGTPPPPQGEKMKSGDEYLDDEDL